MKNKSLFFSRGFTLIELLIGLALLSIFVVALGVIGSRVFRLRDIAENTVSSQDQISRAMQPMMVEIRSLEVSNGGAYPIESASTSSLVFYSDLKKDGLVERVRYYLKGNVLYKGVVSPSGNPPTTYNLASEATSTVISSLVVPVGGVFSYYPESVDINGAPLSYPLNVQAVRAVKISLTIAIKPNEAPGPLTFTTSITPRNLKSN